MTSVRCPGKALRLRTSGSEMRSLGAGFLKCNLLWALLALTYAGRTALLEIDLLDVRVCLIAFLTCPTAI